MTIFVARLLFGGILPSNQISIITVELANVVANCWSNERKDIAI